MVKERAECRARVFAVAGKLVEGDEIALHQVMTWRKLSDARSFCKDGKSAISPRVAIAEMGGSFVGGMTMVIGEDGKWSVKLELDRMVKPIQEGDVVSVLESDWVGSGGARLWEVFPKVVGHIHVSDEGAEYVPYTGETSEP